MEINCANKKPCPTPVPVPVPYPAFGGCCGAPCGLPCGPKPCCGAPPVVVAKAPCCGAGSGLMMHPAMPVAVGPGGIPVFNTCCGEKKDGDAKPDDGKK